MTSASTLDRMSPELRRVAERAKLEPEGKFHSVAHLIDEAALARAFGRLRRKAAVGVDGITVEQYGQDLGPRVADLHRRLKAGEYRHQPIRRVHIPKGDGRTRPIGISATEDKVVQGALRDVLEAVYEQDFKECSHGFRPRRSAHDAMRALWKAVKPGRVKCVLEADIKSFFDTVDRTRLLEMIRSRVPDGSLLRLISKCLHVGLLDGEVYSAPDEGTTQGSVLSPMLGNIYLHYVLDRWFEDDVKPRLAGEATLVRYADDFVIVFERQGDAARVMNVLPKRLKRFGLHLHPEKTRLVPFASPRWEARGKGPGTFNFLGFTWYWRRTRKGRWAAMCKTMSARLARAIKSAHDFCRSHRHESVKVQHDGLCRRLRGHINYFGVNGNTRSMRLLYEQVRRIWFKWLNRRSQRQSFDWKRYSGLLRSHPLPPVRITVKIWTS
jgi:RNA-directed DNA polymerase